LDLNFQTFAIALGYMQRGSYFCYAYLGGMSSACALRFALAGGVGKEKTTLLTLQTMGTSRGFLFIFIVYTLFISHNLK
jgi:hypothetical protein